MFEERLKLARRSSGLSLRALSSAIGGKVSAQAIGKYERGVMMPSSPITIALAEALDVPRELPLEPNPCLAGVRGVQKTCFVQGSGSGPRWRRTSLIRWTATCRIEEILGIGTARYHQPAGAPYPIVSLEETELAAHRLRDAWGLGGGPIPDMPELLQERGIKVFNLDLPGSVDGLSCRVRRADGDDVPAVVYSTGTSLERERFTIAHELGHMILDIKPSVNQERACQWFAGAFLAPRDELFRELGRRRRKFGFVELIEIKHMFGISAAALVMRMRDLRIITDATVTAIFAGIGCTWRTDEPEPMKREQGSHAILAPVFASARGG